VPDFIATKSFCSGWLLFVLKFKSESFFHFWLQQILILLTIASRWKHVTCLFDGVAKMRTHCTGVGAGKVLRVERYFARIFPNSPEKLLCDKLYPYKFSVAVGTIYFLLPCCHKLENRKYGTWNYVLKKKQLKKYAWLCKYFVRSQLAQYSGASASQFRGLHFIVQLLLSARNLRPAAEV